MKLNNFEIDYTYCDYYIDWHDIHTCLTFATFELKGSRRNMKNENKNKVGMSGWNHIKLSSNKNQFKPQKKMEKTKLNKVFQNINKFVSFQFSFIVVGSSWPLKMLAVCCSSGHNNHTLLNHYHLNTEATASEHMKITVFHYCIVFLFVLLLFILLISLV